MSTTGKIVPLWEGDKLAGALALIRQGFAVFPLWWPEEGRCACGDPTCKDVGKHPIGKLVPNGFKNASKDEATVKRWWTTYPKANIGIATGRISGIVVIDVDGAKGQAKLAVLLSEHGQNIQPKNYVETGRIDGGHHYYFRYPLDAHVPSHRDEGLEVKSDGAYVVAPPSQHQSGKTYTWRNVEAGPLEELPKCFVNFALQRLKLRTVEEEATANIPNRRRLGKSAMTIPGPPPWTEAEEARIQLALEVVPADDRQEWFEIGAALHSTGWGDPAKSLFEEWSRKSEKYDPLELDKLWDSFARGYDGRLITLGTLFALAKRYGWEDPPPVEIDELNKKHFLIRNVGGKCLVGEMKPNPIGSGEVLSLQSVDAFKTWYSNRTIVVGNKLRRRPLGAAWLEHPKRRQYEGVDLVPNEPKELPNGNLNLWRGFGVEAKQGSWRLMIQHIYYVLANDDQEAAKYILRWMTWAIQHPGELAEVALVLRGGKGSGKGVFGNAFARCFGEHALHIVHQDHLTGKFNGHLGSCLFLLADEAFWAGDKKAESVLKGLITERLLVIEQKGIDPIPWQNRLKILMVANADWVVPASHDERRFAVFDVSNRYAQGVALGEGRSAYFEALHREIENGGIEAMLYDLRRWNFENWHPRQVYQTDALREQKGQSLSALDQYLELLLQDGRLPKDIGVSNKADTATTRTLVEDAKKRVPRLQSHLSDKAMGDFLRKHGCTGAKVTGQLGVFRGLGELRGWRFPPLAQMRANWSKRYGGWTWDDPEQQDWQ